MEDNIKKEITHPITQPIIVKPTDNRPLDKVKEQTQRKRSKEREER